MEEAKNKKFIIPAKFESTKGETYATGHIKTLNGLQLIIFLNLSN